MGSTPLDEKFPIPTPGGAAHAYSQEVDAGTTEHNGKSNLFMSFRSRRCLHKNHLIIL